MAKSKKEKIEAITIWRKNNPDKVKQYVSKYQEKNKDDIRKYKKSWYERNKKTKVENTKDIKVESTAENTKRWRRNHPDEVAAYNKMYAAENKEAIRLRKQEWWENKEKEKQSTLSPKQKIFFENKIKKMYLTYYSEYYNKFKKT